MNLRLDRKYKKPTYTIGRLYIDNVLFCNTLEDVDRGLDDSMTIEKIKSIKVANETAIPTGNYKVTLDVVSPKYSNYSKYSWSKAIGAKVPRLLNVKGFDGILIHPGNTDKDSSGCILVGENKVKGKVVNSIVTFQKLYKKLLEAKLSGEEINLQIV